MKTEMENKENIKNEINEDLKVDFFYLIEKGETIELDNEKEIKKLFDEKIYYTKGWNKYNGMTYIFDLDKETPKYLLKQILEDGEPESGGNMLFIILGVIILSIILLYYGYSALINKNQEKINIENVKPKIVKEIEKKKDIGTLKKGLPQKNEIIIKENINTIKETPIMSNNSEKNVNNELELLKLDYEILLKRYNELKKERNEIAGSFENIKNDLRKKEEKIKELEKLINDNELNSFIFFLGKEVKKNCDNNKITKEKCVNLYNKYLQNEREL